MPDAKPAPAQALSAPQKALHKLGLTRDIDLALHLPLRYEDETRVVRLSDARDGQTVQVEGTVTHQEITLRPRRQLLVTLDDGSDTCTLRFFSFYPSHQKALAVGARVRVRGEVRGGFMGRTMVHPAFHAAGGELPDALTPVYPTSAQLPQAYLRKAVASGLNRADLGETLPPALYLRGTSATPATGAISAFSAEAVRDCDGPLAVLHSLNAAIHRRFAIDHDSGVDAAALLGEAKSGPCDLAHLFCTGARSLGLPARFVSGFVAQEDAARPHCWAEAYVEGIGWLGFDPAIGLSPTDTHVRVAVALDAAGAVPIAGEAWSDMVSLTDATQ